MSLVVVNQEQEVVGGLDFSEYWMACGHCSVLLINGADQRLLAKSEWYVMLKYWPQSVQDACLNNWRQILSRIDRVPVAIGEQAMNIPDVRREYAKMN